MVAWPYSWVLGTFDGVQLLSDIPLDLFSPAHSCLGTHCKKASHQGSQEPAHERASLSLSVDSERFIYYRVDITRTAWTD